MAMLSCLYYKVENFVLFSCWRWLAAVSEHFLRGGSEMETFGVGCLPHLSKQLRNRGVYTPQCSKIWLMW